MLSIQPLSEDLLGDVVDIHLDGLGYTLNSQLGREHLGFLYRMMAADPECFVGVATTDDSAVGVISGCVDAESFASRLLRRSPPRRLARIAGAMLSKPRLLWAWWQARRIAAPVWVNEAEVRAVLTAIAVNNATRAMGIGRALVTAFEDFLKAHCVPVYRLDTKVANRPALHFYTGLGFQEFARRADSIIFVRKLD